LTQIDKVKAYPEFVNGGAYKMKVSHFNTNKWFAVGMGKENGDEGSWPQHYQWFSNLIMARLRHRGTTIP